MRNMSTGAIFFADILGFGAMARTKGAGDAVDALSDVATVLVENGEITRFLGLERWHCRYGLSDSLFLVADTVSAACRGAAELYFNLAYLNCGVDTVVILRGGIAVGEYLETAALFAETGKGNLVGAAVVEAVRLEGDPLKGPHIFLTDAAATEVERGGDEVAWIVDRGAPGPPRLLWLLPTRLHDANGLLIGDVCRAGLNAFERYASDERAGRHYAGYVSLITRSLVKLQQEAGDEARSARAKCEAGFGRLRECAMADIVTKDLAALGFWDDLAKLQATKS